ncbi:hypothetical protein [Actinopolymorpha rutila]|uniref:Integral membrane protein n=1 Tax=Actinopolymorpha rutila TaxID=446787 RepID=A0A852ZQ26_9ACTN|nr:hypothetical protein [Actinopolymorpha rutila]NYH91549.1 hypothetical protein [Actinopolymorpha rutila]
MASRQAAEPARTPRADYAGAVYGSLLAGSVVAGAGAGDHPLAPLDLGVAVLATGVVFWLAHVYARLMGSTDQPDLPMARIRAVARHEWPIVQAAFPPAALAFAGALLGWPANVASWLALVVAVTGGVGWAVFATAQAGASRSVIVLSGFVNLVLGLAIIGVKSLILH